MELSKQHFDEVIRDLATKGDLEGLATKKSLEQALQKAVAPLATKEQIEELARMTSRGFEDVLERLDVATQIKTFEFKFQKLEEALHIKL